MSLGRWPDSASSSGDTGAMGRLGQKLAIGIATMACTAIAVSCTKDQGSEQAFCRQVAKAPTVDSVVSGYTDAEGSELDARLADAASAYADLAKVAPGKIRGEVNTVVRLVDAVIAAVKEHREDPEVVADRVRAEVVNNPGSIKASIAVATYAADRCKLELNPALSDRPTTTGP